MLKREALVVMAGCAALCLLGVAARAQDPNFDPWAADPEQIRQMMGDEGIEDDLEPQDVPQPQRRPPLHLRRCRMNGLESAQYSAAELHLQRGDDKACLMVLQEVVANTQNPEVRDVTHFNLGEIQRRRVRDIDVAGKHYREVAGLLRHRASERLLNMLAERGKADEAAKVTDELVARAKEKGEKLALLHRLAGAYKRNDQPDRALAVYQRIAKEFTPVDMKQMLEAIEREVQAAFEKLMKLERDGDNDAELVRQRLDEVRPRELRAAGRWDELRAFEEAVQKGHRRMEQLEREREGREERGEQPARPAAPAPERRQEF